MSSGVGRGSAAAADWLGGSFYGPEEPPLVRRGGVLASRTCPRLRSRSRMHPCNVRLRTPPSGAPFRTATDRRSVGGQNLRFATTATRPARLSRLIGCMGRRPDQLTDNPFRTDAGRGTLLPASGRERPERRPTKRAASGQLLSEAVTEWKSSLTLDEINTLHEVMTT